MMIDGHFDTMLEYVAATVWYPNRISLDLSLSAQTGEA